jgi:hypothetical protein
MPISVTSSPTADDVAKFLGFFKGVHCHTVSELNTFLRECQIPLVIPNEFPFEYAKEIMQFHYQTNCKARLAQLEGGHRTYLTVAATNGLELTTKVPLKSKSLREIEGRTSIPSTSPIFNDIDVKVLAPAQGCTPCDFLRFALNEGREMTKATSNSIPPTPASSFVACIQKLTDCISDESVTLMEDTDFLVTDYVANGNGLAQFRNTIWPHYWKAISEDIFVRDRLKSYIATQLSTPAKPLDPNNMDLIGDPITEKLYHQTERTGAQVMIEMKKLKDPWKNANYQDKRGLNVPQFLLNNLELLMFGMMTRESIPVFRRFFGEPNFQAVQNGQASQASVMHDNEFINVIIQTANHAVEFLVKHHSECTSAHTTKFGKIAGQSKLRYLLLHNVILDIMKTVNMYGPDPVIPATQHVAQATR